MKASIPCFTLISHTMANYKELLIESFIVLLSTDQMASKRTRHSALLAHYWLHSVQGSIPDKKFSSALQRINS